VTRPLRVTFLLGHAGLSGGVRVVAIYADRLRSRGHHVEIISQPRPAPALRRRARELLRRGRWPGAPAHGPSHLDGLNLPWRVLERPRPATDADLPDADVLVATWWETAEWAAALSPRKGAKVYFIQHYEAHPAQPARRVDATWRLPMRKIVIAPWLADLARERFADADVDLVPNAVDPSLFFAPPRARQPLPTVGMMYSTKPFKRSDVGCEAVRQARRVLPDLRFICFSAEPVSPAIPLPEGTAFHHRPPQDHHRHKYASCDAWLFPSRTEGFALPVLEAMACRTPVIGTAAGAAGELLAHGAGILVDYDAPEALARAISRLCAMSDNEWRRMSDLALARVSTYSWDDAATLFEQALSAAADRAREARAA
jgi:glycosyltransferase involved in cell wall biosynthesis